MTINRIHHLGLTVSDVAVSAEWYERVLGFENVGSYTSPDATLRKAYLRHDGLGVRIGLCQHEGSADAIFDETRPGLDHLAFAVDGIDELGGWEHRLREHGVTVSPIAPAKTIPGAYVLVFRDPDNIQLELIAAP